MLIEHGAAVINFDCERNRKENGRKNNDSNKRQNNVKNSFNKEINQVSFAAFAAIDRNVHKLNGFSAADDSVGNFRLNVCNLSLSNAVFDNLIAVIGRNAAKKNGVCVFKNFKKFFKGSFFRVKGADNAEAPFKLSDALERDIGINIVENNNRSFCCVDFIIDKIRGKNPNDRKNGKGKEHHNKRYKRNKAVAQKRKNNVAHRLQKCNGNNLRKYQVRPCCRSNLKAAENLDKRDVNENNKHGKKIVTEPEERSRNVRVEKCYPAAIH